MPDTPDIGPWTVYDDPRVWPSISWCHWGERVQLPLLLGQRSWEVTDEWTEGARGARETVLDFLRERLYDIRFEGGVAQISKRGFLPVDPVTVETCRAYRLCSDEDLDAGVIRLRDTRDAFILSAIPMDSREWIEGLPVIEVTVTGCEGKQALLAGMDVSKAWRDFEYGWLRDKGRYGLAEKDGWIRGQVVRPGKERLHAMSRPRWRTSLKATAKRVLAARPQWQLYMEWLTEQDAAARALEAEAETDAVNALVEQDLDIFHEIGAGQ